MQQTVATRLERAKAIRKKRGVPLWVSSFEGTYCQVQVLKGNQRENHHVGSAISLTHTHDSPLVALNSALLARDVYGGNNGNPVAARGPFHGHETLDLGSTFCDMTGIPFTP